jgi:branched-chain amino acid transport system substrate-binding protein
MGCLRNVASIAACLMFGVVLASRPEVARAEDGVTNDTILIGAYGPITGPAAYVGLGGRDGAELALQEINDAGGIHGRKLKLVFEDDAFSPSKALAAVKKLAEQDKVFMVLGVSASNPTVGTVDYLKEAKVPQYVSVASAPIVTHPFDRYVFRGSTTEAARWGEVYSEFLAQFLLTKRIAVLSGADEFAKNEADAIERWLDKWYGIKSLVRLEYKVGDKDFTPQLLKIKEANPEVIVINGLVNEGAIILRQARELGLRQPIFGSASMVDNGLIATAGYATEGFMGGWLLPVFLDSQHPDMLKFRQAWEKRYPNAPKGRPNIFDLMAYGDAYVVAEGLRRAGPELTREKLVDALETIENYRVSEVATPRTFTKWHHIGNLRMQIMIVVNQHWVPLRFDPVRESEILTEYKK